MSSKESNDGETRPPTRRRVRERGERGGRGSADDRRAGRLGRQILETVESQDLGPFAEMIDGVVREHDLELPTVAAALAYLVQRQRPPRSSLSSLSEPRGPREPAAEDERRPRRPSPAVPRYSARVTSGGPKDDRLVMHRYRIEVGRDHGVEPGNIVGAISNEAALDGRYIGRIKTFDTFSLVDLPEGMPGETLRHLKTVRVCGQALQIRRAEAPEPDRKPRRPSDGPPGGSPGGSPGGPHKKFKKKPRAKKRPGKKNRAQRRAGKSKQQD